MSQAAANAATSGKVRRRASPPAATGPDASIGNSAGNTDTNLPSTGASCGGMYSKCGSMSAAGYSNPLGHPSPSAKAIVCQYFGPESEEYGAVGGTLAATPIITRAAAMNRTTGRFFIFVNSVTANPIFEGG